ncbi:MAG TPA: hypothetical protein ENH62_17100 [Marinobacter sp.]|nr:hypothetical protein [Marinobacter sp.]
MMIRRRFIYCKKLKKVVEVSVSNGAGPNRSASLHIVKEHFNPHLGQMIYSKGDQERKFKAAGFAPINDFPHCVEGVHQPKRKEVDVHDAIARAEGRLRERGEI